MKNEPVAGADAGLNNIASPGPPKKRLHRFRRWALGIFLFLFVVMAIGRAVLPWAVRDYVNRTLARDPNYSGTIGQVQIHLYRGAYSIHAIQISKTTGNVPVPLFSANRLDLAIQWGALLHGRVVGRVVIDTPQINFVDAPSDDNSQTGVGGPWLSMLQDLFPFSINSVEIENGSVHFRTYTPRQVDVYLSNVKGSIDNLRNVSDASSPLNANVQISATAMDEADLNLKMTLDPFSYRPTFHMILRLLNLDVTKINDLALAYGKFDFKRGWFDLVVETDSQEGQMTGYVKPLFRNLQVFSLKQDIQEDNPLQFFWQALVGTVTHILKNPPRDQFGTLIPFTADASGTTTVQILATVGNIFRNAFVRAYLPQLEGGQNPADLKFQAPNFTDALSTADPTNITPK